VCKVLRHFGLGFVESWVWVWARPKPKTQRDPDSELNSIHFGKEIKKKFGDKKFVDLKFFFFIFRPNKFLGLKKFYFIFLFICIPKCIKLNSESGSRWVWVWVLD